MLKPFPHTSQTWGFSPVWVRRWRRSKEGRSNALPQYSQGNIVRSRGFLIKLFATGALMLIIFLSLFVSTVNLVFPFGKFNIVNGVVVFVWVDVVDGLELDVSLTWGWVEGDEVGVGVLLIGEAYNLSSLVLPFDESFLTDNPFNGLLEHCLTFFKLTWWWSLKWFTFNGWVGDDGDRSEAIEDERESREDEGEVDIVLDDKSNDNKFQSWLAALEANDEARVVDKNSASFKPNWKDNGIVGNRVDEDDKLDDNELDEDEDEEEDDVEEEEEEVLSVLIRGDDKSRGASKSFNKEAKGNLVVGIING